MRPQNSAVRERGIVHRVWRCLARLRIGTRKTVGDLVMVKDRVSTTLPQLPLPVMVNVRDDIGIGIRSNRAGVTPNVFEFVNVPAPLCVQRMVPFVLVASVTV